MCQASHRFPIEFQNFITCWEREEQGIVAEKSVAPTGGVTPTLNSTALPHPRPALCVMHKPPQSTFLTQVSPTERRAGQQGWAFSGPTYGPGWDPGSLAKAWPSRLPVHLLASPLPLQLQPLMLPSPLDHLLKHRTPAFPLSSVKLCACFHGSSQLQHVSPTFSSYHLFIFCSTGSLLWSTSFL